MTVGVYLHKSFVGSGKGGYKSAFYDMEFKGIRRVRTAAGAKRYKVPIGSVIVGNGKRLENVTLVDSDYSGWDKLKTPKGDFYAGSYADEDVFVVADANDKVLFEAASMEDVLTALDDHVGRKASNAKAPKAKIVPTKPADVKLASSKGKYKVGQQVTVTSDVAARRIANGGGRSPRSRQMEIAGIEQDAKGKTVYRLRTPGSTGKGGQVRWPEEEISADATPSKKPSPRQDAIDARKRRTAEKNRITTSAEREAERNRVLGAEPLTLEQIRRTEPKNMTDAQLAEAVKVKVPKYVNEILLRAAEERGIDTSGAYRHSPLVAPEVQNERLLSGTDRSRLRKIAAAGARAEGYGGSYQKQKAWKKISAAMKSDNPGTLINAIQDAKGAGVYLTIRESAFLDEMVDALRSQAGQKGFTVEELSYKAVPISTVDDQEEGIVTALVAVTGIKDNVNDIILPGAFEKSLISRKAKGVWHHDVTSSVSKTLDIKELRPGDPALPVKLPSGEPWPTEAGGLWVKMQFNLNTQRGRDAYEDVKFFGADQEWSIGYNVPSGGATMDRKTGTRSISTLNLYEYSPVLFGAMPNARTLMDVKSAQHAWKSLGNLENDLELKSLFDELMDEQKAERTIQTEAGARRYGKKVGDKYGTGQASGRSKKRMEEDESPLKGARGGTLVDYEDGVARYSDGSVYNGERWVQTVAKHRKRKGKAQTKSEEFGIEFDDEEIQLFDLEGKALKPSDDDDEDDEEIEEEEEETPDAEDEEDDEEEKGFGAYDFTNIDDVELAIKSLTDLRDAMIEDVKDDDFELELKDDLVSLCKDAGLAVESAAETFDNAVADGDTDAMESSAEEVLDAVEEALEGDDPDKDALKLVSGKIGEAFEGIEDDEEEPAEDDEEEEEKSESVIIDTKSFLDALG